MLRSFSAIGSAFSQVPDKQQAWNDLHRLTNDKDSDVRYSAVQALGSVFSQVPDKQQAWNDLLRLTNDEYLYVRYRAAEALVFAFSKVPDKQQALNDLLRLTNGKDSYMRERAAQALGSAFSQVPDKQHAWNDLLRLTNDEDSFVRISAVQALGSAFSQVPDKQQAWNDLLRLTKDRDSSVMSSVASALDSVFSQVPYKQQAWTDLHRLTNDEDSSVRSITAYALCYVFSQVPDKQQAWNDLHRLTNDEYSNVRSSVASALGSAFSQVPDKQQAWSDLLRLTNDENMSVRSRANHSLGRVSIFKASQAETDEDYKTELEKAIKFFETAARKASIAAEQASYYDPSQFCFTFYRSFHTIIFNKQEAIDEVNKCLEEAKAAIKGSESKKQLFEAVQNLAEALKEVQNMGNLDLSEMKSELDFYRKYCDHAEELMKCTEEKAPFATEVLRKGFPILDRNLKGIIEEIQEKARTAYKESIGSEVEETARAVCKEVQKWEIGSQEYLKMQIESLVILLKSYVPKIEENNLILNGIDKILQEPDVVRQYILLNNLIPHIIDIQRTSLFLKEIKESINELQNPQEDLDIIHRDLREIKDYMPRMKWQIDEVLSKLDMPSSTVTQKLEIAIPIIPNIASYKIEADVPKFVDDRIHELNNFFLRFKKK